MPGSQIPQKAPNNWQSRSSQRSIECRYHANTKPRLETLRPRIGPKSIGRFCYHYAKLENALAPYQLLEPNEPSGMTQSLSPFARRVRRDVNKCLEPQIIRDGRARGLRSGGLEFY